MNKLDELTEEVRQFGLSHIFAARGKELLGSAAGRRLIAGDNLAELIRADAELRPYVEERPRRNGLTRRGFVGLAAAGLAETQIASSHAASLSDLFRQHGKEHSDVRESDGRGVKYIDEAEFRNWGRTVRHRPSLTFEPRTKHGVCEIVKWARARGKRVRAAGYRHSWSDTYSQDGGVLISILPVDQVETLPASHPPMDPRNELQGIKLVGTVKEDGVTKALCRIGAATTKEQFREWCLDGDGGAWKWTVPLNVIMVEITWGGSNAQICHGAGSRHKTLGDLVAEVEFVNARGRLQKVSDPKLLRAAAGAFGLLGIVTSLTLKLDPMTFATFAPTTPRVGLAIPPPRGYEVPAEIDMSGITEADLEQAKRRFVAQCEEQYYAGWFWFPYQKDVYANCWQNHGKWEDAQRFPNEWTKQQSEFGLYMLELSQNTWFKALPGRVQGEIFGAAAMNCLPSDVKIVTPVIEALHHQRGIQNFRVVDLELEIPIPPRADDPTRGDWTIAQRAWWDAIRRVYARADAPMRIVLELRIMGGSNVTMAAQHGNLRTASIEVLTSLATPTAQWRSFMQEITDLWTSYTDHRGRPLNVRPHWGKQWREVKFHGRSAVPYLRDTAYVKQIPKFRTGLRAIAKQGGYTTRDLRMFSNPLYDQLFRAVFR
ncbi:MAG: FAD-binding protein [Actinomycetota bacterium]|nr:FAD-binding protein [Actinomycetota bacterium]